jgi:osmoprotectant transport system ATP-binding protein
MRAGTVVLIRARMGDAMIEFRGVSKIYPGSERPVVNDLSFEVLDGEICVLVGPSGCGKTTSMRMINRLIEPSSGKILINGEPNTAMSGTRLRRHIGYAIQQIGLFPHRTIAANIATVPQLLEWEKNRIAARVDELLELVGLDPEQYRNRYPAELSGGQQQRVGVARAMAADPPIMLMDEPFGAVDPITRHRLQDEFLRIQGEIQKTIVFVTHDIDEAIKMGDRIAILQQGGILAQYDTPENNTRRPELRVRLLVCGQGQGPQEALALARLGREGVGRTERGRRPAPPERADKPEGRALGPDRGRRRARARRLRR